MSDETQTASRRFLDPIDRVSEILFGLIMVLTSTSTISVLTSGRADVATMIIGALGCNLAWGIIDAALYLMGCLNDRGRDHELVKLVQGGASASVARRSIAEALPEPLGNVATADDLEEMRQRLLTLPALPRPHITRNEWLGALGVCLLVFLSTFPAVIPFFLTDNLHLALRISNGIAIVTLFFCGHMFARHAGLPPVLTGLSMVVLGLVLVGVAILLGG